MKNITVLLCVFGKHKPVEENVKDMFGYSYTHQRVFCERCGKRLHRLERFAGE